MTACPTASSSRSAEVAAPGDPDGSAELEGTGDPDGRAELDAAGDDDGAPAEEDAAGDGGAETDGAPVGDGAAVGDGATEAVGAEVAGTGVAGSGRPGARYTIPPRAAAPTAIPMTRPTAIAVLPPIGSERTSTTRSKAEPAALDYDGAP